MEGILSQLSDGGLLVHVSAAYNTEDNTHKFLSCFWSLKFECIIGLPL